MKHFSFYIAMRYLCSIRHEKSLSTMVKICFFAIALSTFALALVAMVMRGFEKATFQTLQSCHAPITMQSHGNHLAYAAIEKILHEEFPGVHASPSDINYVMLEDCTGAVSQLVILKGINPDKERLTTAFEKKIITHGDKKVSLNKAVQHNSILIGYRLAHSLNLTVGDTLTTYFVPEQESARKTITLDKTEFMISGIFKTGIEEFDSNLLLCSLDTLQKLFPSSGITSIHISFDDSYDACTLQKQLAQRFKIGVYTWKDRYPALVAALTLETYASFIILTLIVLVASMSIFSLLYMLSTQKRGDIAILRAMGASSSIVQNIFLMVGMTIASIGACIGLLLSYGTALVLQKYVSIELPDAYYVSHLPVSIELSIFMIVFGIVITISFFATWLATRGIKDITIAHVLRFEA